MAESWMITSLTVLLIFSGTHHRYVEGQECTWNPRQETIYTRSSGAPATLNVSVSGEVLTTTDRITWEMGGVDISVRRHARGGLLEETLTNPRGNASSSTGYHGITIPSVNISDNGLQITVISGGCSVNETSQPFTLQVECCNVSYFHPASSNDTSCCGYNCTREFVYPNGSIFNAICQEDASWNWEASAKCSWTITQPPSPVDNILFRIAKGAPAQFTYSVTGEDMQDKHQITWEAETSHLRLSQQSYNASTGEFDEIENLKEFITELNSYKPGMYRVVIPAINFSDYFPDSVAITVESNGCRTNRNSPRGLEQALCCNMSFYDRAKSYAKSCCIYQCIRKFIQPRGSGLTATCQKNATWAWFVVSSSFAANPTIADKDSYELPAWVIFFFVVLWNLTTIVVSCICCCCWCKSRGMAAEMDGNEYEMGDFDYF